MAEDVKATNMLSGLRARVEDAIAAARCSAKGALLEVDANPGVDESVLGDVVASAASLAVQAAELVPGEEVTALVVGRSSAIATRRLRDGSWATMLVGDAAAAGLALEALAAMDR